MADEKTPAKRVQKPQGPRPAYLILKGDGAADFAEAIASGVIQITGASRKAEEVLEAVATGVADAYVRIVIK